MPQFSIQSLSEAAALKRIVETVQGSEAGSAPFALILGSGFSDGLVPTARELVEEALPLWIKCRAKTDEYEALKKGPPQDRTSTAQDFWKRFVKENGLSLPLNSDTWLPLDYSAAYRAAFDSHYYGAVGAPAEARRFLRALMRLDVPRLNAAHFLLASLLGVQPGRQRKSQLFKAESAFCRLILTTNFDPFLQIALQSVNRLYLISDTPELGVSDEILDDQIDAIHLVYVHGSIHRRSQATTDEEITQLKEKNARTLKPVLERHGVIVLGYSGWDDAIVEAVAACDRFDHRLYWCGREADPLSKSSYGPRAHFHLRHRFEPGEHVHVDRGHHIMPRNSRSSTGVDSKEIEANQFAACLLMPSKLVLKSIKALKAPSLRDDHVEKLADEFNVSEQAITIRLSTLGFL
jgi:IrrE N-terminal-like domain/SIR2-like domain